MEKQSIPLSDIEAMIGRLKNEPMCVQPHFYGVVTLAQWQEIVKMEKELEKKNAVPD